MEKQELLKALSAQLKSGEMQREEVLSVLGEKEINTADSSKTQSIKKRFHLSITKILYILGILVALLGIIFFVAQIWDEIGSAGRIVVTLILGFVFAGTGSHLLKTKPEKHIGSVFHIIGGLLIPGGAMVTLSELSTEVVSLWPVTITIGVIFAFYTLITLHHKSPVLTFFALANGTAFLYLLVESIITGPIYQHGDIYAYLTMVVGLSYLLFARSFKETWNNHLVGILNFFGALAFLGAAFSRVFDSGFFEMLFFLLAFGGIGLAVYLKSKSILVVSTLFLIGHFAYITGAYFADSIGWPLSLIILGFVFIGLGYSSITLNKKYINNDELPGV